MNANIMMDQIAHQELDTLLTVHEYRMFLDKMIKVNIIVLDCVNPEITENDTDSSEEESCSSSESSENTSQILQKPQFNCKQQKISTIYRNVVQKIAKQYE
ncbi:Hypothetical_protein [Hexamita inflata]|uniref:Hypothetical_protein n=1 Tax=Hexamita inflata TaxID=28002 RepID=A0ABP1I0P4_9EUKA